MNIPNPLYKPLQFPVFMIFLATAALAIAAVQWLIGHIRGSTHAGPSRTVSPEFAERFCMRTRISHQS